MSDLENPEAVNFLDKSFRTEIKYVGNDLKLNKLAKLCNEQFALDPLRGQAYAESDK